MDKKKSPSEEGRKSIDWEWVQYEQRKYRKQMRSKIFMCIWCWIGALAGLAGVLTILIGHFG